MSHKVPPQSFSSADSKLNSEGSLGGRRKSVTTNRVGHQPTNVAMGAGGGGGGDAQLPDNLIQWLNELYKRDQEVLDVDSEVTLTGDVTGGPTAFAAGDLSLATIINLPNVTIIDGGASDTSYAAQTQGPYGVAGGGGGSAIEVEDGGVSLTTGVTKFNFVGFSVSEPTTDEITIRVGPAGADDSYSPGYNYTQQSTTTFTIDLANALALFRTGRRIKFGSGGTYTYGVVASGDYNSTHANDTFITMTMEASGTIPASIDELYLVSSDAGWSPIATDPFGGTAIRGIATGPLSGTQWWVAVGDGGKLFTSTDAGVTWTSRTSGTTGDLLCVTYNARDAEFMVGGETTSSAGSLLLKSTTGTSWSSVSIPWVDGANDYVKSITYSYPGQYYCCSVWDDSATTHDTNLSLDSYATFTPRQSVANGGKVAAMESPNGIIDDWYISNATITQLYINFGDGSGATSHSHGVAVTALSFEYNNGEGASNQFSGDSSGRIYYSGDLDDATFSNPIRDFATAEIHQRTVCVGDSGTIGYIADANLENADAWVSVANGFAPTANVLCVEFNETDGVFVACADNGQICRSSTGIS